MIPATAQGGENRPDVLHDRAVNGRSCSRRSRAFLQKKPDDLLGASAGADDDGDAVLGERLCARLPMPPAMMCVALLSASQAGSSPALGRHDFFLPTFLAWGSASMITKVSQ